MPAYNVHLLYLLPIVTGELYIDVKGNQENAAIFRLTNTGGFICHPYVSSKFDAVFLPIHPELYPTP